jgi:hypothetical protein
VTTGARRTLLGPVVAGVALVLGGLALAVARPGTARVAGILAVVLGLACLRIAFWVRRARMMTRVGMSLRGGDPPED